MEIPGKALAFGAALVVGIMLGMATNDGPVETKTEVKVIEVPTVKTKVEYRDKMVPWPSECSDALDALPKIIEGDAAQTAAVGKVLLALQELSTASAFNDTNAVNEAIAVVRKEKGVLSATIADRSSAITVYEVFLSKCEAAIAASS
jgi:hypothetical protein